MMKTIARLLGVVVIGALVCVLLPPQVCIDGIASDGASSQEDAEAVLDALARMNELIREGTRKYEAGEIGLIELWEQYMSKAMDLKYQAMTDAFPDVFGYPFVQLYNHLEWIDKSLEVFKELASQASSNPDTSLDPASFSDIISELEREKGKLEGVIERFIVDRKRAEARSATQGRIGIELPAGQPLSCNDIDGALTPRELSRGSAVTAVTVASPETFPITVWAMHDSESVYLAFEVLLPSIAFADQLLEAYIAFDVSRDGAYFTAGDDMKLLDLALGEATDFLYEEDYVFRRDIDFGGQHDVCAAIRLSPLDSSGVLLEIEFLIPLNSGDRIGADPALSLGDSIAVTFGLITEEAELQARDELILTIEN